MPAYHPTILPAVDQSRRQPRLLSAPVLIIGSVGLSIALCSSFAWLWFARTQIKPAEDVAQTKADDTVRPASQKRGESYFQADVDSVRQISEDAVRLRGKAAQCDSREAALSGKKDCEKLRSRISQNRPLTLDIVKNNESLHKTLAKKFDDAGGQIDSSAKRFDAVIGAADAIGKYDDLRHRFAKRQTISQDDVRQIKQQIASMELVDLPETMRKKLNDRQSLQAVDGPLAPASLQTLPLSRNGKPIVLAADIPKAVVDGIKITSLSANSVEAKLRSVDADAKQLALKYDLEIDKTHIATLIFQPDNSGDAANPKFQLVAEFEANIPDSLCFVVLRLDGDFFSRSYRLTNAEMEREAVLKGAVSLTKGGFDISIGSKRAAYQLAGREQAGAYAFKRTGKMSVDGICSASEIPEIETPEGVSGRVITQFKDDIARSIREWERGLSRPADESLAVLHLDSSGRVTPVTEPYVNYPIIADMLDHLKKISKEVSLDGIEKVKFSIKGRSVPKSFPRIELGNLSKAKSVLEALSTSLASKERSEGALLPKEEDLVRQFRGELDKWANNTFDAKPRLIEKLFETNDEDVRATNSTSPTAANTGIEIRQYLIEALAIRAVFAAIAEGEYEKQIVDLRKSVNAAAWIVEVKIEGTEEIVQIMRPDVVAASRK